MYKLFMAAAFTLISSLLLNGQDIRITGTLTDEPTSEPLPFAHVGVMGTSVGSVTNSDGQFALLIPEKYQQSKLSFSYLGYSTKSLSIKEINPSSNLEVSLRPQSTYLPDLVVKVDRKSIIEEAIELIPENHDQGDMRLSGFWRAQIRNSEKHIQLSETAFDIFKVDDQDALQIMKARACRDTTAYKDFSQFEIGIKPKGLFNSSFIMNMGVLSKKVRKKHVYELVDATVYNDRPVLIVAFDRKEDSNDNGFKGTILLDAETLAFVQIRYEYSPSNPDIENLYGNRLLAKIVGFGSSTIDAYKSEFNYQLVNGKWYLSHAFYDLDITLANNDASWSEFLNYRGDFVVTNIAKENVEMPEKDDRASKNILVSQSETGPNDFWEDFNYLVPDKGFDKVFEEIEEKNKARKK